MPHKQTGVKTLLTVNSVLNPTIMTVRWERKSRDRNPGRRVGEEAGEGDGRGRGGDIESWN